MGNGKLQFILIVTFILLGIRSGYAFDFQVTDNAPAGNCTTMCANPAPGTLCLLQNALDVASCNDEDDTVNIAAGNYDASGGNDFTYIADANENFSLTLIGDAGGGTILDAMTDNRVMYIETTAPNPDDNGDVIVQQITFQNGGNGGRGLEISTGDGGITVEACKFLDNHSSSDGGGLFASANMGDVLVSGNLFLGNSTDDGSGGGFFVSTFEGFITVVNNILSGNQVTNGGQGGGGFVNNDTASVVITNNTIFDNSTDGDGGGLAVQLDDSPNTIDIFNNIIWQNMADGNGSDIYTCEQGAVVNLFNNDFIDYFSESVDGSGCGSPTTINEGNNKNVDPLFVNSAADDFHLTAPSPVIDMGDPAAPAMPSTDYDGNPRPALPGTNPDMGALEFQPPPPPPTPTPTPLPTDFIEGSGALGCALQRGPWSSNPAYGWLGILSMGTVLGTFLIKRRKET